MLAALLGSVVSVAQPIWIQHCMGPREDKPPYCFIEGIKDDQVVLVAREVDQELLLATPWHPDLKIDRVTLVHAEQYERLRLETSASFAYAFLDGGNVAVGMMGTAMGQIFSVDALREGAIEDLNALVNMPSGEPGSWEAWLDGLQDLEVGEGLPGFRATPTSSAEFLPQWSDRNSQLMACEKTRCTVAVTAGALKGAQEGYRTGAAVGEGKASAESIFGAVVGGVQGGLDTLANHESCEDCLDDIDLWEMVFGEEEKPEAPAGGGNEAGGGEETTDTLGGENVGDVPDPGNNTDPQVATPSPDDAGMTSDVSTWHDAIRAGLKNAQGLTQVKTIQAQIPADQALRDRIAPLIIFTIGAAMGESGPNIIGTPPQITPPTAMDPPRTPVF